MESEKVQQVFVRLAKESRKTNFEMALDFLNQFVVAGVEYPQALKNVLDHFKVDRARLEAAWAKA